MQESNFEQTAALRKWNSHLFFNLFILLKKKKQKENIPFRKINPYRIIIVVPGSIKKTRFSKKNV